MTKNDENVRGSPERNLKRIRKRKRRVQIVKHNSRFLEMKGRIIFFLPVAVRHNLCPFRGICAQRTGTKQDRKSEMSSQQNYTFLKYTQKVFSFHKSNLKYCNFFFQFFIINFELLLLYRNFCMVICKKEFFSTIHSQGEKKKYKTHTYIYRV